MNLPVYEQSDEVAEAIRFATHAHAEQVDKEGVPVIHHALAVMEQVVKNHGRNEVLQIIAVLHDVVEDTEVTLSDIRARFGDEVFLAINAITRRKGEVYIDYIIRCELDKLATLVKIADLEVNIARGEASGRHPDLLKRYKAAMGILTTNSLFNS